MKLHRLSTQREEYGSQRVKLANVVQFKAGNTRVIGRTLLRFCNIPASFVSRRRRRSRPQDVADLSSQTLHLAFRIPDLVNAISG
jgi:hypothetical protein